MTLNLGDCFGCTQILPGVIAMVNIGRRVACKLHMGHMGAAM